MRAFAEHYHGPWDEIRESLTDPSAIQYTWFESHLLDGPWHRGRLTAIVREASAAQGRSRRGSITADRAVDTGPGCRRRARSAGPDRRVGDGRRLRSCRSSRPEGSVRRVHDTFLCRTRGDDLPDQLLTRGLEPAELARFTLAAALGLPELGRRVRRPPSSPARPPERSSSVTAWKSSPAPKHSRGVLRSYLGIAAPEVLGWLVVVGEPLAGLALIERDRGEPVPCRDAVGGGAQRSPPRVHRLRCPVHPSGARRSDGARHDTGESAVRRGEGHTSRWRHRGRHERPNQLPAHRPARRPGPERLEPHCDRPDQQLRCRLRRAPPPPAHHSPYRQQHRSRSRVLF